MKRLPLLLLLGSFIASPCLVADTAAVKPDLFKEAKTALAARQFDAALDLYERAIIEHPEIPDRCWAAQQAIANTLAVKGDLAEAAKAAHIALDCAPTSQAFDESVHLAAKILSALDKDVTRANQLLAFQQTGPVNGAVNPMEAIGYPSQPDREKALEKMREQAGDNAAASRLRAYTFLLAGKPREALAQFADAFHRAMSPASLQTAALELASTGLRALRGHRGDQAKAAQFIQFGPNGSDGKPKTEDDPGDPFEGLLPAFPAGGEGGLAGLSTEDVGTLRRLRDGVRLYVGDPWVRPELRRDASIVMQQTTEALDDWGAPGQKDWYLQLVYGTDIRSLLDTSIVAVQAAARSRALHLAEVTALWKDIDAHYAALGTQPPASISAARKQFDATMTALCRLQAPPAPEKPLAKPMTF